MSHLYEPVECLDCDELILLHRNGSGHDRCGICDALEPNECTDEMATTNIGPDDLRRTRHQVVREIRATVTAGMIGDVLQKHFEEFKDVKQVRMHDYGKAVADAVSQLLDEIEGENK